MRRTHLGIQAAIVLSMVAFVSWPQFRPVRAQSVWRYVPDSVLQARTDDAARYAGSGAGVTNASFSTNVAQPNAIFGVARTSLNMPIPYARVSLRSIRTGQLLARGVANAEGLFSFFNLDPNAYIIELLGADGAVVATSPMMTMERGDVRQTEVRVPVAASTVQTSFGNTLASTLPLATTVAASNDVTRTTSTFTPQESPR